jgi:hypothetical protein
MGYRVLWLDLVGVSRKGSVYDWLLSMCCGSFIVRFREMAGVFAPSSLVNASRRMWSILERKKEIPSKRACGGHRVHSGYTNLYDRSILGWSSVDSAFSFATR